MSAQESKPSSEAPKPALLIVDMIGGWDFPDGQALLERASAIAPLEAARAAGGAARAIADLLAPRPGDYRVLKPRHSAYFATPLSILLDDLGARRLVITGVTGDQCVLMTAADARMNDMAVAVPADCIASLSDERHARSLHYFAEVLGADVTASAELKL
jgi:nicotinamidase-related amidase